MLVRARVWTLLVIGVLLGAGAVFGVAPALAQERHAATVSSIVDGDTLNTQVAGGPALEVQVIGIDAPEPGDCGADDATGYLKQLALGRNVMLVSDPALEQFQSPGARPLFYVDRDDGRDVGQEMVRAGWADIWFLSELPTFGGVRLRGGGGGARPAWRVGSLWRGLPLQPCRPASRTAVFGAVIRRALLPAALRKAVPRGVGDAVASRAPRGWPVRSLEGRLPPLFGDDGRGFASSRVRATSGGADSPARP
jgi:hypothetical protein